MIKQHSTQLLKAIDHSFFGCVKHLGALGRIAVPSLLLCIGSLQLNAQIVVPDWALPASPTHKQVPPPANFHRPTVNFDMPIGIFKGQSDIGGPLLPGSARYDRKTKQYIINSASYNIWYTRDEMRYVWKKTSVKDASFAADITFPTKDIPVDRKVVLVFRQDLDDDSKEVMVGLHGPGLIHLAYRPEKNANMKEACKVPAKTPAEGAVPIRIGIEKRGDTFALFVSLHGEPMHQEGATATLKLDGPFYVGIGFCSHVPDKTDTGIASNVVFKKSAGKVK